MNINDMSEDEQIEICMKNEKNILRIRNPSEKVQMAAVRANTYAIIYIEHPTEKVVIYVLLWCLSNNRFEQAKDTFQQYKNKFKSPEFEVIRKSFEAGI